MGKSIKHDDICLFPNCRVHMLLHFGILPFFKLFLLLLISFPLKIISSENTRLILIKLGMIIS